MAFASRVCYAQCMYIDRCAITALTLFLYYAANVFNGACSLSSLHYYLRDDTRRLSECTPSLYILSTLHYRVCVRLLRENSLCSVLQSRLATCKTLVFGCFHFRSTQGKGNSVTFTASRRSTSALTLFRCCHCWRFASVWICLLFALVAWSFWNTCGSSHLVYDLVKICWQRGSVRSRRSRYCLLKLRMLDKLLKNPLANSPHLHKHQVAIPQLDVKILFLAFITALRLKCSFQIIFRIFPLRNYL